MGDESFIEAIDEGEELGLSDVGFCEGGRPGTAEGREEGSLEGFGGFCEGLDGSSGEILAGGFTWNDDGFECFSGSGGGC